MRIRIALLAASTLTAPAVAQQAEWTPLFNGEDLAGWHEAGGGKWSVEEGAIIGERGDGTYGWLVTDNTYADFVLELEFKMEVEGNSGIQFRSHIIDDLMHGMQADIYPPHVETGSVYDEHGRGWLAHAREEAQAAVKPNDWNRYRITAIGPHIKLEINDVVAAEFDDDFYLHGVFALQVHSGDEPLKVLWRDIRIRDLGWGEGWTSLFNGTDLAGWIEHGAEEWGVQDGAIAGAAVTDQYGYLGTEGTYEDFEVRIEFRCEADGNSGLFFHSELDGTTIRGVQCEIDPTALGETAGIYESGGRGWLVQADEKARALFRAGDWNTMRVRCVGNRTTTWLNGRQVVDYVDEEHTYTDGVLALQLHSGGNAGVRWREIHVRPPVVAAPGD